MLKRSSAYIIPASLRRLPLSAVAVSLLLLVPVRSRAQDNFTEDTVSISAVTVTARAAARLTPYSVVTVDPDLVSRRKGDDLAALLQSSSLLYVKRYGNHGLASVSVRGLSGSHTLVTWNGMPVNSPGNGYSDFTVIPVAASTSVQITAGGSDLSDLSGYLGGKIELAGEPLYGTGPEATLSVSAGSYGDYGSAASVSLGGDNVSFRVGAWANRARNDYVFINRDAPGGEMRMRRTNAASSAGGFTGDVFYRTDNSRISMHLWFNEADRQLPGPVTTVQQDFSERQTDRSYRGVVNYSTEHGRLSFDLTAGGQHDVNRYYHMEPSYNGDNSSSSGMIRTKLAVRVARNTSLEFRAGDSYERAVTMSYDGAEKRNLLSFSVAGRSNPLPRINLLLQLRKNVITDMKVSPEFTAGASWLMTTSGEHLLKASLSRNSRLPCLNDLYWIPGGNPDLVPENSAGGEVSWSFLRVWPSGTRGNFDLTLHASHVNDLIQWVPGQSGLWQAENVRDVNIAGAEARAGRDLSIYNWTLRGVFNYSFTRSVVAATEVANDRSIGRQLVYAPLHHANLNLTAGRKWFTTGMTAAWESRRFTTSDNTEWMPGSLMTDAFTAAAFRTGSARWRAEMAVSNIPGLATESVKNYPMPLRTFKIKLTLTWSEKQKKDETPD